MGDGQRPAEAIRAAYAAGCLLVAGKQRWEKRDERRPARSAVLQAEVPRHGGVWAACSEISKSFRVKARVSVARLSRLYCRFLLAREKASFRFLSAHA